MFDEEDFLMLSGIQHFAFCRRQWALIHIEKAWKENVLTIEGKFMHEKAHNLSSEKRGEIIITRSMPVMSRELGISGVCDVVELWRDDCGICIHGKKDKYRIVPVEYKRGRPKENNADELQLCAQALCLEEMFVCDISEAYLFYGETKRRSSVKLSTELRIAVKDMLKEMHNYYKRGYTPKTKQTKACKSCSLNDICLPKILKNSSVTNYINTMIGDSDV